MHSVLKQNNWEFSRSYPRTKFLHTKSILYSFYLMLQVGQFQYFHKIHAVVQCSSKIFTFSTMIQSCWNKNTTLDITPPHWELFQPQVTNPQERQSLFDVNNSSDWLVKFYTKVWRILYFKDLKQDSMKIIMTHVKTDAR